MVCTTNIGISIELPLIWTPEVWPRSKTPYHQNTLSGLGWHLSISLCVNNMWPSLNLQVYWTLSISLCVNNMWPLSTSRFTEPSAFYCVFLTLSQPPGLLNPQHFIRPTPNDVQSEFCMEATSNRLCICTPFSHLHKSKSALASHPPSQPAS